MRVDIGILRVIGVNEGFVRSCLDSANWHRSLAIKLVRLLGVPPVGLISHSEATDAVDAILDLNDHDWI